MAKVIDLNQPVYSLCTQHPELIALLQELGFSQITKPGMLQTAGKVMTLPNGCRMRRLSIDTVIQTLEKNGYTINK